MGDCAQVILFYGIGYEEDSLYLYPKGSGLDPEVEIGLSLEKWKGAYAEACGVRRPEDYATASTHVCSEYLDRKAQVLAKTGCVVGRHGSCHGEQRYYVSLRVTEQEAWQGEVNDCVHLTMELSEEDADREIWEFCEKLGLPYRKPSWVMVACFG